MKIFKKAAAVMLATVLIGGPLSAQERGKGQRAEAHQEMKTYVEQNVIPVMKPQREKLETYLSAKEQKQIDEVRAKLEEHRKQREEHWKTREDFRQSGERPSETERAEFREKMQAQREAHRKEIEIVRTIAENHKDQIQQLYEEVSSEAETWKSDIQAIREKYRPEGNDRPGRGEFKGKGQGMDGHHPGHGKGKGPGHPGGHGPDGGMMGLHNPVRFLLWDTEKGLGLNTDEIRTFPNPATSVNTLEYTVSQPGEVRINLINDKGIVIKTVVNETQTRGEYQVQTDVSGLEKGMYFYQIKTPAGLETRKIVVDK